MSGSKYDYSGVCDCGAEMSASTLSAVKGMGVKHIHGCEFSAAPVLFIDRHFAGSDIDDSFASIKIKRVGNSVVTSR